MFRIIAAVRSRTQQEPRQPRQYDLEGTLSVSRLQQFAAQNSSSVLIAVAALTILVDLAAVVMHFVMVETADPPPPGDRVELLRMPMQGWAMVVQGLLGVAIVGIYVGSIMVSSNRVAQVLSLHTVAFLISAPLMITSLISYNRRDRTSPMVPAFLRIWWATRNVTRLAYGSQHVSKPVRAVVAQVAQMTAIVVTCTGAMQMVRMLETGEIVTFVEMLYFTVVTLTTVGYGDITPLSRGGRVVVGVEIFVAMVMLPLLINDVAEVSAYFEAQKAYNGSTKHILIVGHFTEEDASFLFREHLDPDHRFLELHLVLISPEPFDAGVRSLAESYALKHKVTLCVGSPRQADDLRRFAPRTADAALFYSSARSVAQRGDYKTILLSKLFERSDPDLPLYFMLKRSTHSRILHRSAYVIFDREREKFRLLGASLLLPGLLPLYLNLVRSTGSDADPLLAHLARVEGRGSGSEPAGDEDGAEWFSEYLYGATQSIYLLPMPDAFAELPFIRVASLVLTTGSVQIIGIVRSGQVHLNPGPVPLSISDRLVVVARNTQAAARGIEDNTEYVKRTCTRTLPPTRMRLAQAQQHFKPPPAINAYPFSHHIVIIDIASARPAHTLCEEEGHEEDRFLADDLMTLVAPFPVAQGFVSISLRPHGPALQERWQASGRQPIFHLEGSPLDAVQLEMACLPACRGVLIFASREGEETAVLRTTALALQRRVLDAVPGSVPVVVSLESAGGLCLFEPRLDPTLPPSIGRDAEENEAHSLAYATGGVMSTTMLDSLLQRTYYNESLPKVVMQLLDKGVVNSATVASFVASAALTTYGSLSGVVSHDNLVLLGISRIVRSASRGEAAVGRRYTVTNPPADLWLRGTDRVFFIAHDESKRSALDHASVPV